MPAKKKVLKKAKKPAKVSPIPPGLHTVTPHLSINGAAQAIDFYKKAFGAKQLERQAMPDGKLLHASVKIGDSIVMMADEFPNSPVKSPTSIGASTVVLHIYTRNVDKLWQQAVAAGAKVTMPLENQFWGERYGQVDDPFGHKWSMSSRVKMSREEMKEKQEQAMAMFAQGQHAGRPETATPTTS